MPSTYSPILRTELVALGEQAGTWNGTNNANIGTFLEAAIAGTATHNTAGAADTTLTALNGTADEARNAVIKLTGVLTGSHNVICPSVSKLYLVINATTGAFSVTFKTSAGTGVVVPQGSYMYLYCDGTNVLNPMTGAQLVTPALGTPTSGTLTNCTGLPVSTGIAGMAANIAAFLATPSSANLAAALTDETGTGAAVFANSPTLVTPNLGTPSALVGTNITGTAAGLSIGGTAASASTVASGATGTTQAAGDNSTKIATTEYVDRYHGVWTFTANGTWTKPTGADANALVLIECWGGGGGGSNSSTDGGGGGGYASIVLKMSQLGATETVTVGAGGATGNPGTSGGTTSFGTKVQAGGGGGGASGSGGGAGGGYTGATTTTPGATGTPLSIFAAYNLTTEAGASSAGSAVSGVFINTSGGGDGGRAAAGYGRGSYYGGGGGSTDTAPAWASSIYGGAGGATGGAGTAPGGGGGSGGAGARGEVRVRVI